VRARIANAPDAVDGGHRTQQVRKIVRAVVVRVDVWPSSTISVSPCATTSRVSRTTSSSLRLRSEPRVYGTMQYVQR
jgi:hypothetical protein